MADHKEIEKIKKECEYWEPQPRQLMFLECFAYEALYGGAKGGGKTDALLAEAYRQVHIPRYRGAIFRREITRLSEVIDRSQRWFSLIAKWNEQKKTWTFPSGAKIHFFHCQHEQDKNNHQGKEYHFIGFDQIEEFTESQYDFIKGGNRTADPSLKCYVRCTANPGNVGHAWVKNKWIDKLEPDGQVKYFIRDEVSGEEKEVPNGTPDAQSRAFVFAKVYDNQALLDADPNYLSVLKNLPKSLRLAFLEGDWDAFEGQYFAEFRRSVHVIPYTQFKHNVTERPITRYASMDYGFTNPSAIHFHAVMAEGKLRTYKEIYSSGMDYVELAKRFKEAIEPGEVLDYLVCDPAIQGDKSHHTTPKDGDIKGESGFNILQRELVDVCPVVLGDNRRVIGWTRMHEFLKVFTNQHDEEDAFWKITANCTNLIRTLPTLIHSKTNPEDVDTNCEDHAPDGCRYGIMSRPQIPKEPGKPLPSNEQFWKRVKMDIKRKNTNNPLQGIVEDDSNSTLIGDGEEYIEDG